MSTSQVIANRFEISDVKKDLLGRGGMGDVYRGTDTQTGQPVAIKALKPEVVASNPDIVARFVHEGEALRQLNHPNIVKMVAAIEEAGQHFLVMEYVKGGSLQDLLDAEGALPVTRVLEISLEVADALTRAHHLDIIHRDLKPSNVLLAEDDTPCLTDFGMARFVHRPRLTQTGTLVGTPLYLSPEACQGERLDARADIWAFGVMLYEMLAGGPPFTGETFPAVVMTILTQPVPDLSQIRPDVSDGLADLIYRMLEKDRQQRIPSVRLVGAELEAMLKGREIVTSVRLSPADSRFATPTPPADAPRHNLPVQATPFIGRKAELTELARLLDDPTVRLLTILGAGGMGKTRLALKAGEAQIGNFEHGVYFVSLAPLQTVDAIVPTVAEALGFSFYTASGGGVEVEPRQQLLDYLCRKRMLLIMDNFEHLLACPERGQDVRSRRDSVGLVSDIFKTAPDVKVLSTSRARLKVQGEQRFHLAGMDFPDWETPEDAAEYSAVKLFLQSARRARPEFELEAGDLKYISRICRLVGGMPLGIRMAAAWVEMLTPEEIAAEVGQGLDFLETDLSDVPERQRSVRAVFDYSWNLLTGREQEVFMRLSVFRGGFTREAVQQVTSASLRELIALVDKSLLHRAPTGRYEVHELLRQYAEEKLDQEPGAGDVARDLHSAYYTAALEQWEADLKGPRQRAALAEMDAEIENARMAWEWAAERGQVERLDRAMEGLCLFYFRRARFVEGEAACRVAASKLAATPPGDGLRVWSRILAWQGFFSLYLEHRELTGQLLQQSLALLEEPALTDQDTRAENALVLFMMGWVMYLSDTQDARRLFEQSLALYRALGDHWWTAYVLRYLGTSAHDLGSYGEAKQLKEESLTIGQSLGDRVRIADSLAELGVTTRAQGQLEEAERLYRESLAICQEMDDRAGIAYGLYRLGEVLVQLGKFAEGCSSMGEGLAIYDDLGLRYGLAMMNSFLGEAKAHLGQYEQARTFGQRGLTVYREIDYRWGISFSHFVLGLVAVPEEAYAEAHQLLQESVAVFREIGHRENMGYALAVLGYAARGLGQLPQARQHLYEALRTVADIGAFMPFVLALPAAALLLADQGEVERAVELYGLASRYPFVTKSRWFEDVAGRHISAVAATLPPEVVAVAQERGRARDLEATVAELLAELGE